VLDAADAAGVLEQVLKSARGTDERIRDHPKDAERLARLCGFLPLALRIVAALLAQSPRRLLSSVVSDLADERTRLDEMAVVDLAIRAAFDLSYRHLAPPEARVFRLLAVNLGPDVATTTVVALTAFDEHTVQRTRRTGPHAPPGARHHRWPLAHA
jgi:hypothetical protein